MEPTTLKEALLTLRNLDAEAYKALLIASTDLERIMGHEFLRNARLRNALESEDGFAITKALERARQLVPWFEKCTNRPALALGIFELRKEII